VVLLCDLTRKLTDALGDLLGGEIEVADPRVGG
jgi:hypothetical protein